ncbi:hypothetical protein HYH03_011888 [Edaphochlamys debaryana]|uniref:RHOMBOID-like protein n=1 Tax=Edaphochlamys debaryana TaxID=47281 RepID=A0A835XV54_9CHLO|nr:hypothetical protein HYH03_011888 [Edaphochlamys debaryana]|eukprot:KAG2489608.1 hypothetical protein HYH03_011888 [Edaphochlamys debaryana]
MGSAEAASGATAAAERQHRGPPPQPLPQAASEAPAANAVTEQAEAEAEDVRPPVAASSVTMPLPAANTSLCRRTAVSDCGRAEPGPSGIPAPPPPHPPPPLPPPSSHAPPNAPAPAPVPLQPPILIFDSSRPQLRRRSGQQPPPSTTTTTTAATATAIGPPRRHASVSFSIPTGTRGAGPGSASGSGSGSGASGPRGDALLPRARSSIDGTRPPPSEAPPLLGLGPGLGSPGPRRHGLLGLFSALRSPSASSLSAVSTPRGPYSPALLPSPRLGVGPGPGSVPGSGGFMRSPSGSALRRSDSAAAPGMHRSPSGGVGCLGGSNGPSPRGSGSGTGGGGGGGGGTSRLAALWTWRMAQEQQQRRTAGAAPSGVGGGGAGGGSGRSPAGNAAAAATAAGKALPGKPGAGAGGQAVDKPRPPPPLLPAQAPVPPPPPPPPPSGGGAAAGWRSLPASPPALARVRGMDAGAGGGGVGSCAATPGASPRAEGCPSPAPSGGSSAALARWHRAVAAVGEVAALHSRAATLADRRAKPSDRFFAAVTLALQREAWERLPLAAASPHRALLAHYRQKKADGAFRSGWERLEAEFVITGTVVFDWCTPARMGEHWPLLTCGLLAAASLLFFFMAAHYPYWVALQRQGPCARASADVAQRCWAAVFPTRTSGPPFLWDVLRGTDPPSTSLASPTSSASSPLASSNPAKALLAPAAGAAASSALVPSLTRLSEPYLRAWGGRYAPDLLRRGQGYRWLTSSMLHTSFRHLAANMALLAVLGWQMEIKYGTPRLAAVWLAAVVGCSGGCFGLLGLFVADLLLNLPTVRRPILRCACVGVLLGWLAYTLAQQQGGLSNMSHLGGLLCGLLPALVILPRLASERCEAAWPAVGGLALVVWFSVLPAWLYAVRLPQAAEHCA